MHHKLKTFWEKYETKIILVFGFVLVSGLSFEAGMIKGANISQKPLIIEKITSSPGESANYSQEGESTSQEAAGVSKTTQAEAKAGEINNTTRQNCAFVGSKNSNKYHLPTCRWAKNIKPENRVCFSSEDEAKSRGYLPDKNCIK